RLALAVVRYDECAGAVHDDPGAAEQREQDEADAVEDGVDVEVAAEAAADAGDQTVGPAPMKLFECGHLCGHGSSLLARVAHVDPESPWSDPYLTLSPGYDVDNEHTGAPWFRRGRFSGRAASRGLRSAS